MFSKASITRGLLGAFVPLAAAASAFGFQALPPGGQVNDDKAAGIDKTLSVSGEGPANADVVGGALTGGKPAVPWAVLRQTEPAGAHDQIFARSFAGGSWTTRGSGTVGGRSSAAPQFSGSLNFDQGQDGEAPAIDFAGTERTVPWATWYENTSGTELRKQQHLREPLRQHGRRQPGQVDLRRPGPRHRRRLGAGPVAEHRHQPGRRKPVDRRRLGGRPDEARSVGDVRRSSPASKGSIRSSPRGRSGRGWPTATASRPRACRSKATCPRSAGFCWQQTGIPRSGTDPSLNVDTSREGVEPDIAFTGTNDGVPWIVWYEKGPSANGLHANEMVFAAKGVKDGEAANGGFHWVAVGQAFSGTLDTSGTNHLGPCGESGAAEVRCSLNRNTNANAEDPRVASGTMNPANPTSPWVTWDEEVNGVKQVFVSHLVGSGAEAHFELANGGAPISTGTGDATRPDITFSGHTPYVTWRQEVEGTTKAFTGHFANPATLRAGPERHHAHADGAGRSARADLLDLHRDSVQHGRRRLPGRCGRDAVLPARPPGPTPAGCSRTPTRREAPVTGDASAVDGSSATVNGTVNPQGAAVKVSFQFGTTTAYGQTTRDPDDGTGQHRDRVRRAAERAAGGHDDPLPRGRQQRLRHLRRRRPDADDDRPCEAPNRRRRRRPQGPGRRRRGRRPAPGARRSVAWASSGAPPRARRPRSR